ncbi:hypothetical protein RA086_12040 [Lactiplantibacillus sp. WILCCON 0030]|uniref:Uncharacterized protein n=1 Tax=Lactiplantibacillus brownii TaxID=3069269 RepID=A0ABU1ABJ2_9LACO|nr:hypothetical protein [Lactiplantibacillus brownii]MDQ7938339.1 hypothetical protein [Lactiplantibacillus brownii]
MAKQILNDNTKYYRRHSTADIIFVVAFLLSIFMMQKLYAPILVIVVYVLYAEFSKVVLVSPVDNKIDKIQIDKATWKSYKKRHHISTWTEYNAAMIDNKKF